MSGERKSRPSVPPSGGIFAGAYRILRKIAEGGMGTVYEAQEVASQRQVALKVLLPQFAELPEVQRRFRRESSILTALDHPSIVRILDVGTDEGGLPFMAMELLTGETLADRIKRLGRMEPPALVPIITQLCGALQQVHEHGVVHGDVKPANVFLLGTDSAPVVKLVDFGLSKVDGLDRLTRTGELSGTPCYMAPELFTGEKAPDGRCDTYAIGVILYEAIAGEPPFFDKNAMKLMTMIVTGKYTPLAERVPSLSPGIEAVVERAMSAQVSARFREVADVAAAFKAAVG